MKGRWSFLTAGFAMFSMFFGSGNLVFPLSIGYSALDACLSASLGLLITGVLVPFLGLLALIFAGGSRTAFFAPLGRGPAFLATLLILGILGPFGVCARCVLVSYGSLNLVFPGLSLPFFSALFCLLAAVMTLNRHNIVPLIGRFLTPLLLFCIIAILALGIFQAPLAQPSSLDTFQAFLKGLHQGYQTMDLLAAFFFSATVIEYLRRSSTQEGSAHNIPREAMKASCVGLLLLGLIYVGFVSLGASYAPYLDGAHPENMLILVAKHTLQSSALPVIALTIVMACLTTLIILCSLFADFIHIDVCREKISRPMSLSFAYFVCFGVSLVGFGRLVSMIGAVLEVLYPAFIALSLISIVDHFLKKEWSGKAFYLVLGLSGGVHLFL